MRGLRGHEKSRMQLQRAVIFQKEFYTSLILNLLHRLKFHKYKNISEIQTNLFLFNTFYESNLFVSNIVTSIGFEIVYYTIEVDFPVTWTRAHNRYRKTLLKWYISPYHLISRIFQSFRRYANILLSPTKKVVG